MSDADTLTSMDSTLKFILSTPEYQGIGLNLVFVSFLVTAALTFCLQLPGLINQSKTIWRNRSAEGVNMLTFIAFFTYFVVFLAYAFLIKSGAGLLNALVLLPPQLFILAGILRFKKIKIAHVFAALGGVALFFLIILFPEFKEKFFVIASLVALAGLIFQPIEMFRTKTSANVALSFPVNFSIVSAVWALYGTAIGDWFLAGASGVFALVYLTTVIFWFKYRLQKSKTAT